MQIAADVAGFATSLGRSGANITGLSFQTGITIPPNVWAPTDTVIK